VTTIEAEYGVPAVGVHADAFARLVAAVTRANGMPGQRRAFVPTPVMGRTREELRAYVHGADPTTGRPFVEELLAALTRPLSGADAAGAEFDRSTPRLLEPATEEELQRLFRESGWTDYLPIVLPTEARVEAMLAGTSRGRDEVVGRLRPTNYREQWEFTVEKVAVNAVMAGAAPEHLPVILALAASGVTARSSTTSSSAAMVAVNGPIRQELTMNTGIGALGPYSHANAAIGRAYSLLSQNLQGGSVPGVSYVGAIGNPMNFAGITFAENEEQSPWEPYHVQQGFSRDESTVSIFLCLGTTWSEGLRDHWDEKLAAILSGLDPFLGVTLVLDPSVARELHDRHGFATKQDLARWIHENVRIPARRYWDYFGTATFIKEDALLGIEPWASYLAAAPDDLIPVFEPEWVHILVVGGSSIGAWSAYSGRPLDARLRGAPDVATFSVDVWR
jgi:hypothetical protein